MMLIKIDSVASLFCVHVCEREGEGKAHTMGHGQKEGYGGHTEVCGAG